MSITKEEVKQRAETDLAYFIRLIAPHRLLGNIHEEVIRWWTKEEAKSHQLLLLPRAHQKSVLLAYRVAWRITKDPSVTVLYLSSSSGLAQKQLSLIKQILTSKIYRQFWPDMVNQQEGKRTLWNSNEIAVDHPKRKEEGVRDPTVFTAGLDTSITGLHCDVACLDDVVVQENAYTEEGRRKVALQYSLLSSIENPGAEEWTVGTRYHHKDLYKDLMEMEEETFDEDGNPVESVAVYETFQREVEDRGDGTGEFIWPRQQRKDGTWFGFNTQVLMKKKAQYLDKAQFWAQYYNDPNNAEDAFINKDDFQYFDRTKVVQREGHWWYMKQRLNIFAAIDFAFSMSKRADFTAIVVIGIDSENNIYILDIDRFKSDRIADYYDAIHRMYQKWEFRKMRAEINVAQQSIVRELKDSYIKPNGLLLKIDEYRPQKSEGVKEERIQSTLEPRYDNQMVFHYRGGNCQLLEEELVARRPPHDDIKDALTAAIDISVAPKINTHRRKENNVVFDSRFGGVAFK